MEVAPSSFARGSLALGISTAILAPFAVHAQTAPAPTAAAPRAAASAPRTTVLNEVTVQGKKIDPNPNAEVGAPYKAKTSGDQRYTRPLAEIPQTISVITKEAINDSGFTDLKQILGAQPGITLGTGENGNSFGDRYIIRGQEARSDVFVDGLRDPGMTTRESFAIEQLEISKGANSSFAGRGTAGGAINAITKQATLDYDFTRLSFGLGTDSYTRLTADINKAFSDTFALRANVLFGDEGVPDRRPSSRERKGLALSGVWELSRDFSVTLDYYGLRANDRYPDNGSFLRGTVPNRFPVSNTPVYAQSTDFLGSDVDTLTARIKYRFSPDMSLNSLTRYGRSNNAYNVSGSNNTTANTAGPATVYATGGISFHSGWQEVEYFAHQTNLRVDRQIAGMKNEFIFGVEYTDHQVLRGNYTAVNQGAFNCRTGTTAGANNGFCTTLPNGDAVPGLNTLLNRRVTKNGWNADWQVKTLSLSAMDTVDITDRITAFGGLRLDRFDFTFDTGNNGNKTAAYGYKDTLVNGHFGVSYKINPAVMVYSSVSTSGDINGGESDVGTNSGYGGAILVNGAINGKPEKSTNFEIGTKLNILDDKLLLTAALFRNRKNGVMEGNGYTATGTVNSGKNQVEGVEFGLAGNITEKLSAQVGVAFMKSKVLASATPANVGLPLANFADKSFSAQVKYQVTPALYLGVAARHESDKCGGQPDSAAGFTAGNCAQPIPGFTAYDLFGGYRFSKNVDLRVNVLNVTDEEYYTAGYRAGFFLYKGDARAVRTTLNVDF